MDVFVTGPQTKEGPWGYPPIELIVCENIQFYWDGTGQAYLTALPVNEYGWKYFEIRGALEVVLNGSRYVFGGGSPHVWQALAVNIVSEPPKNIIVGLNSLSLYLSDNWTTEIGIRPEIWISGPGITRPMSLT